MTKPLRITDRVWERKGNNLEYYRIVKRFEHLQHCYSKEVNNYRRNWESFILDADNFIALPVPDDMACYHAEDCDVWLKDLRLVNSGNYARQRGNKYLMLEDMTQFPIMNYDLKEGPYCPPDDAVFGPEDKHVVIQGDNSLIFFQTEINGLEKGLIVENLL